MNNKLTSKELIDIGIRKVWKVGDQWYIKRIYKNKNGDLVAKNKREISITRPNGSVVKVFNLKVDGHTKMYQVTRVIYVWFKDNIPEGYKVAFLDGDSANIEPYNLYLRKEGEGDGFAKGTRPTRKGGQTN